MKQIMICTIMLVICLVAGITAARFIGVKKKLRPAWQVILSACFGFALFCFSGLLYLSDYYPAAPECDAFLKSSDTVSVRHIRQGYYFDGPGTEQALIFYPGGKVEAGAYAPFLHHLSEAGIDAFLVEMPFRMAFLGTSKASSILEEYDYPVWYLAGHSLGGAVAASYAASNSEKLNGLILLAAYPVRTLPDSLPLLSIYGSMDGVLNHPAYDANKKNWPADGIELLIEGGNHAGFGSYGAQKGDNEPAITGEEQQRNVIDAILDCF